MSTAQEIKQAIQQLPRKEFWELSEWFDAHRAAEWDRQIEADAKAGKLNRFAEEAIREYRAGKTRPLP